MMSPPCSMDGYAAARRPPVVGAAGMRAAVLRNAVRRGAASRPPGRRYSGGHRVPRLVGRGEGRVALAQVVVADLAGAAHVVVGEVDRVQVHLVGHVLVPVQAARRRPGSWTRPGGAAPRIPRRRRARRPGVAAAPGAARSRPAWPCGCPSPTRNAPCAARRPAARCSGATSIRCARCSPRTTASDCPAARWRPGPRGTLRRSSAGCRPRWPCPGRRGASCPDPPRPGRCSRSLLYW